MMLFWKIRFFDRKQGKLDDRLLYLDTTKLTLELRAAVEIVADAKTNAEQRKILQFKYLFKEGKMEDAGEPAEWGSFSFVGPVEYFEDCDGNELSQDALASLITGKQNVKTIPHGARQHDIDLMFSESKPIPFDAAISQEEIDLLGLFGRDLAELMSSTFLKEGPGSIKATGDFSNATSIPKLVTATTDEEIRSTVIIFRRLYMEKEPANFQKTCTLMSQILASHPYGKWLKGAASQFESELNSPANILPFVKNVTFTRKRLVDVFLYTQYAHQPSDKRTKQYHECLLELGNRSEMLTWMFLTELWKLSLEIGNAGRFISAWFRRYCDHHNVSPNIIDSVKMISEGIGSLETNAVRSDRILNEKAIPVAEQLWVDAGKPEGGPHIFHKQARKKVSELLGGDHELN